MTTRSRALPDFLRGYFWECDFDALRIGRDAAFIIERLLSSYASKPAKEWLRGTYSDERIRTEIVAYKALGLSYAEVREWIPRRQYDAWAKARPRSIWAHR